MSENDSDVAYLSEEHQVDEALMVRLIEAYNRTLRREVMDADGRIHFGLGDLFYCGRQAAETDGPVFGPFSDRVCPACSRAVTALSEYVTRRRARERHLKIRDFWLK